VELPPPEDDGGLAENYGLPLAGYYGSGDVMNSSWVEGGLGGAAPSDAQQQQEDAEAQRSERVSLTGWRGARNSVGIGASGPTVFCDVCCLGRPASSDDDHIASEMMQAGSITRVMARQDKLLTRKPWDDRDRRCARHACYKGVISWQFGGSLGAGNRVRLPGAWSARSGRSILTRCAIRTRVTIGLSASGRATTLASAPPMSRVLFVRGSTFLWT
jgi:hypothetical protein